jgi:hypothetical protein
MRPHLLRPSLAIAHNHTARPGGRAGRDAGSIRRPSARPPSGARPGHQKETESLYFISGGDRLGELSSLQGGGVDISVCTAGIEFCVGLDIAKGTWAWSMELGLGLG